MKNLLIGEENLPDYKMLMLAADKGVRWKKKFLLFQHGEINGKSTMLSYWHAWCKNVDSW